MCDWDNVKALGAYLLPGIDDGLVKKLSSSPDSMRYLGLICRSMSVFAESYPDDAGLIEKSIFDTDFSRLPGGEREEALARDVFGRLSGRLQKAGDGDYGDAFASFDTAFRRYVRWFKAALNGAMCVQGLKEEDISLESASIRQYLTELRDLPCRRLGELSFSHRMQGSAALSRHMPKLLKKYENRVIPEETCSRILEIMGKVSGFPGYYRAVDSGQRLAEARPVLIAISGLQLDPAKEPEKASLLSALSILLFNVFPSTKLLKLLARFKPDPENDELSYEYYAILSMNHMLAGKPDEASSYNEKALEHATDEEKRAYTHILDSCIRLRRSDFNGAANALIRCSSLTNDKKMRAVAFFYLGVIHYETGNVAEACECFKRSRAGMEDELDSMNACNNIGACAMLQGDLKGAARAFEHVEHVSKYMSSNTAKLLKAVACGSLGIIRLNMTEYELAVDHFKEALKLYRDTYNKKGVADQLGNIGVALKLKRDYGPALEYFKSSLNVSLVCDYAEGALFSFSQVEQVLALEGRYGEVEGLKQEMVRHNPDMARMLRR
jgi:tetratricopeptide (TPR) repeat protein